MFSSPSLQYQDLFQACLGFARQLSQSPGLYCRLEVKLGDKLFNCKTGSCGKYCGRYPGKRKSSSNFRRDQRRRKPPGKGMSTPGNHGVGSVAPRDSTGAQSAIIFSPASSSPPCSITVTWLRHLFSSKIKPHLDRAASFIPEKGLDIQASALPVVPLVKCQCSQPTPLLHPTRNLASTQTVSHKPVPYSPLSQTPI